MKELLLVTSQNHVFRDALVLEGYRVTEYNLPVTDCKLKEMEILQGFDVCITEVPGDSDGPDRQLASVLRQKGKVVCFAGNITKESKNILLDNGISDVLQEPYMDTFTAYLGIIGETSNGESGSFIILDDNEPSSGIIKNIITRFNYEPVPVRSVEELIGAAARSGVRFILVNLGTRSLDLNGLVRKLYSSRLAAAVPILVYKDMREGLFVHELVSGLNRVTRFVLSLDELYSFLVDILYKQAIMPLVASLKKLSDFDNHSGYIDETISRIFFMNEKTIFNKENILNDKNFEETGRLIQKARKTLLMVLGLKWLRIEMDKKDISTGGREG